MRSTSQKGISLITSFEGCRLKAYKAVPTEKYWTIGYGHYGADVQPNQVISQQRATELLKQDLKKFEAKVNKYDAIYHWTQDCFDAMVSFAYNVGSIDQLTNNGKRSLEVIAEKIPAYDKSGGNVLAGLTRRRNTEKELFMKGMALANRELPLLKLNSTGPYVKAVQTRLENLGYLSKSRITGIYDTDTVMAVKAFQADYKDTSGVPLSVDGKVGSKTYGALLI